MDGFAYGLIGPVQVLAQTGTHPLVRLLHREPRDTYYSHFRLQETPYALTKFALARPSAAPEAVPGPARTCVYPITRARTTRRGRLITALRVNARKTRVEIPLLNIPALLVSTCVVDLGTPTTFAISRLPPPLLASLRAPLPPLQLHPPPPSCRMEVSRSGLFKSSPRLPHQLGPQARHRACQNQLWRAQPPPLPVSLRQPWTKQVNRRPLRNQWLILER